MKACGAPAPAAHGGGSRTPASRGGPGASGAASIGCRCGPHRSPDKAARQGALRERHSGPAEPEAAAPLGVLRWREVRGRRERAGCSCPAGDPWLDGERPGFLKHSYRIVGSEFAANGSDCSWGYRDGGGDRGPVRAALISCHLFAMPPSEAIRTR